MRRPTEPERLYLDFDGFFASVEQAAQPRLRGRPVGIVPHDGAPSSSTCVIAVSREAKLAGLSNVMSLADARRLCPDLILVPQRPDLYRRAQSALLSEISAVLPIDAIKSIDELTCRIEPRHRGDPLALGRMIKSRIRTEVGPYITCSIGHAANRQLAKMACKAGKRAAQGRYGDGNNLWHPSAMPGPLLALDLSDIPGVGSRMVRRLMAARVYTMADLLATQPRQMRALWRSVTGERLWYALHGYDVQTPPSSRGMFGHGRVLDPSARAPDAARAAARLLLVKAARRMRREHFAASGLHVAIERMDGPPCGTTVPLREVIDDHAVLAALEAAWASFRLPSRAVLIRVHVTLYDLTPAAERQLDMIADDDGERRRCEAATAAIDGLNRRYGRTVVSVGPWAAGHGYAGGKISFTRIPRAEDFQ